VNKQKKLLGDILSIFCC